MSVTMYSGSPKFAKTVWSFFIVSYDVANEVGITLTHFENECAIIKINFKGYHIQGII